MTTVSQEAREAAADCAVAQSMVIEFYRAAIVAGEWDDWPLVQAFAKFEQSIRQSAERGEVVGYINAEMLNRKSEFEANGMVMFDRPCGAATMPLYADPPSARITGDKDRSVQSRAPTQRIIILTEANRQLAIECHRLRAVLRWIADTAYVDHQSGNQNFEHLQSIARDALTKEPTQ